MCPAGWSVSADVVGDVDAGAEVHRGQRVERPDGVGLGVEREGRGVLGVAPPVGPCRLLLVEVAGVGQHDAGQLGRAGRAPHRSPEAVAHEGRQVAAVVDVGVGEHDRVDAGRRDGEALPVALPQLLQALEEAAVDEHPTGGRVEQEAGAGDGAGGPEEAQDRVVGAVRRDAHGANVRRPARRRQRPATPRELPVDPVRCSGAVAVPTGAQAPSMRVVATRRLSARPASRCTWAAR